MGETIATSLTELGGKIDGLHTAIEELENVLSPIMASEPPSGCG